MTFDKMTGVVGDCPSNYRRVKRVVDSGLSLSKSLLPPYCHSRSPLAGIHSLDSCFRRNDNTINFKVGDKPGFVYPPMNVGGQGWSFLWDVHCWTPQAAYPRDILRGISHTWPCSGWGLPCSASHPADGELLPRHCTLSLNRW